MDDVYLMRLEQFYPWPVKSLSTELSRFPNAGLVWCQEEPKNMGGWTFVDPGGWSSPSERLKIKAKRARYVGRPASASTAAGQMSRHMKELADLPRRSLRLGFTRPDKNRTTKNRTPLPMADIMTPALGESVTEATVARWTKKAGEAVRKDEILVELETDKVSLEVAAPADGVLEFIAAEEGATVEPGAVLGPPGRRRGRRQGRSGPAPKAEAAPTPGSGPRAGPLGPKAEAPKAAPAAAAPLAPSAQRIVAENNLDAGGIAGSGKDGRVTKGDAMAALEARASAPAAPAAPPAAPRDPRARGAGLA